MIRVILIGAGHAHALLLNAWRQQVRPDVELVVITPQTHAPYSGMIPGWLAGQYTFEQTVVGFEGLCKRAGATLIQAELSKLDPDTKTVWLSDGQSLSYDWLTLNVGSTLNPPPITASGLHLLAMRPLATLKTRYEAWLARWQDDQTPAPLRLTAVGGGAAGFESLLCVLHRLRQMRPDKPVHARLVTRSASILPAMSQAAQRLALKALARSDVTVDVSTDWSEAIANSSDLVLWATGAQAHAWQQDPSLRGSLQTDNAGYIAVDDCLRSLSHPDVFAVGDCAALPQAAPKAGVYAVRMGATLIDNLSRALDGQTLVKFVPQRRALALLNTADGGAIASWGPLAWQGRSVMRWKDRIDRGFIERLSC